MKRSLWKLYLLGRKNEYKFLGFIWARADQTPQMICTRHDNLCADIVKDTSTKEQMR